MILINVVLCRRWVDFINNNSNGEIMFYMRRTLSCAKYRFVVGVVAINHHQRESSSSIIIIVADNNK